MKRNGPKDCVQLQDQIKDVNGSNYDVRSRVDIQRDVEGSSHNLRSLVDAEGVEGSSYDARSRVDVKDDIEGSGRNMRSQFDVIKLRFEQAQDIWLILQLMVKLRMLVGLQDLKAQESREGNRQV